MVLIYKNHPISSSSSSLIIKVAKSKRYKQFSGYSIQEVVDAVKADFGTIDYLVHSLANGPEVTKPLLETSRAVCEKTLFYYYYCYYCYYCYLLQLLLLLSYYL